MSAASDATNVPQDVFPPKNLASVDRLVLAGFMGSGKTTVGALLAERLGWQFVDLDQEIERLEGISVPRIFAERGEPEFRRLETVVLAPLLAMHGLVIALGGGAPESLANQSLLRHAPRTMIVHLTAPFETMVERCRAQAGGTVRPVLADVEAARSRFALRRKIYEELADHSMDTSSLSEVEAADLLLKMLSGSV